MFYNINKLNYFFHVNLTCFMINDDACYIKCLNIHYKFKKVDCKDDILDECFELLLINFNNTIIYDIKEGLKIVNNENAIFVI